jgi:hypothetical protein
MRRLPLFLALVILALLAPLPAQEAKKICFKEVPNCIEGRFADYWSQNGGLALFGFPLNAAHQEQIEGKRYLVQLFERNRFELHPETKRPYDVLLGRLGDERLRQIGRSVCRPRRIDHVHAANEHRTAAASQLPRRIQPFAVLPQFRHIQVAKG